MAEEKIEQKITLEREYIIPLRAEWLKVPEYKRATKAVKAIKQFLVRHMKIYDRDLRKIKVDVLLNNEIRFRGIRYPPAKIKVKAIKYENGEVAVKLVDIPKHIEFQLARKAKQELEKMQKGTSKEEIKKEVKEETKEQKIETKEKEVSSKEAMQAAEKSQAKQAKHTSKTQQETPKIQRKALKK